MGKLFNLKTWLTVEDAAKYLSVTLGEGVAPADVLQLVLEDKLKICVHLPSPILARKYIALQRDEALDLLRAGELPSTAIQVSEDLCVIGTDEAGYVEGTRELSRYGTTYRDIVAAYQRLITGRESTLGNLLSPGLVFVGNLRDGLYRLAGERLPDDAMFVIPVSALREFEDSLAAGGEGGAEKPLGPRERETLLKVIGGLVAARYKTSIHADRIAGISKIVDDLASAGVDVSEKTLSEKLKSAS
jgi:hypothetical protein